MNAGAAGSAFTEWPDNRLTFWVVFVPWLVLIFLFNGAVGGLAAYDNRTGAVPVWVWLVGLIVSILLIWIYFAILVKRLHDRDKSAKWLLLSVVPIIGFIWVIVELGCFKGTVGANRYGSGGSFQI
ncbi:DUF805 domain-containing protein [Dongia deserti]|uniref:DUF805 domain-containing protein n=1 Tax=Dongia deserti TaxID=2268030 RepID=UPI002547B095|nr:DUF805 domain-containing protein [Dongia deserti]